MLYIAPIVYALLLFILIISIVVMLNEIERISTSLKKHKNYKMRELLRVLFLFLIYPVVFYSYFFMTSTTVKVNNLYYFAILKDNAIITFCILILLFIIPFLAIYKQNGRF